MTRLALLASSTVLALVCAAPLAAQQSSPPSAREDTSAAAARGATKAAADSAVRELERAMSALAVSVKEIVAQTANKPEVRLAAVQVAGRAVTLAQRTLAENANEIEKLLVEASRRLDDAERAQKAKTAKP